MFYVLRYLDRFGAELDAASSVSAVGDFDQHRTLPLDGHVVAAVRDAERLFLALPRL